MTRIEGKGLGSLIPRRGPGAGDQGLGTKDQGLGTRDRQSPAPALPPIDRSADQIVNVPVGRIDANPFQPRRGVDHVSLDDLIRSIRQHGIIQPLIMSRAGERYQLIAGERRFQAARILGLKTVPVIIRQPSEQQKLELALVENIQRQDLNPIDRARGYQRLMDDFNLTQDEVARRVGKARVSVAQSLRLLSLPQDIQQSLIKEEISEGHAKVLLSLPEGKPQHRLWRQIVEQRLTVRKSEGLRRPPRAQRHQPADPQTIQDEEALQGALGTRVRITQRGRRGSIVIEFFSTEERHGIIKKILKS